MRNRFFLRHCSDEHLLAHLDGEVSALARMRINRHLDRCWHCRSRRDELEVQAHAVSKTFLADDYPWPTRIAEGKARLQALHRQHQSHGPEPRSRFIFAARKAWKLGAIAAGAVMAISGFVFWRMSGKPELRQIVEDSRHAEITIRARAVHQVFRVDIAERQPAPLQQSGILEVWYDGGTSQFASEWKDAHGALRHALWRPAVQEEYVFDASTAARPVRLVQPARADVTPSQLIAVGTAPKHLEDAFLRWLESRTWNPIGFESGLLVLVSEEGVRLTAEPVSLRDKQVYRLKAIQKRNGVTAEVTVDVDRDTYQPTQQTLRLDDGVHRLEVRLVTERCETQNPRTLPASLFRPSFPIRQQVVDTPPVIRPPVRLDERSVAAADPAAAASPDAGWLDEREVEIHYALHQAGACLGEPVQVNRKKDGVTVSGVVETAERRSQLMAMLSKIGGKPWLDVELKIPGDQRGLVRRVENADSSSGSAQTNPPDPPGWQAVAEHFRTLADARQRTAEFATHAITLSDGASREGWALRRLAERYGSAQDLSPRARSLLQRMLRDHEAGARRQALDLQSLLRTIWTAVPQAESGPEAQQTWAQTARAVFDRIERVHSLVYRLFTGADLGPGGQGKPADPGSELATCFQSIELNLASFEARVSSDLQQSEAESRQLPH
ncbi:MAG: hypothetical protein U0Q18_36155 [Bryobacteraceae bacterium]